MDFNRQLVRPSVRLPDGPDIVADPMSSIGVLGGGAPPGYHDALLHTSASSALPHALAALVPRAGDVGDVQTPDSLRRPGAACTCELTRQEPPPPRRRMTAAERAVQRCAGERKTSAYDQGRSVPA
jgi:hypothetical protein